MDLLLFHFAEITRCREHETLDIALASALHQLTGALSAATLAVIQAADDFYLQTRVTMQGNGRVRSEFEAPADPEKSVRVTPCDAALADAIRRKAGELEQRDGNGHCLLWLPVCLGDRVCCCVRLEYAAPCDADTRTLIRGIVKVYANHKNLIDYSERDALTGLLNRRTFDTRFARMTAQSGHARQAQLPGRAERRHSAQARENWLAVVDIDHFKNINDRFGHVYGDEVLILVANMLKASFRSNERIFRFGGEEFVVLLRAVTLKNASLAFERFRKTVEEHDFPQVGRVTVSLGYASISSDTPVVILGHADQALYYAKQHGRNQIQLYDQLVAARLLQVQSPSGSVEIF
ncbi:GGDEF domain-containing protein|uniref:GGDEF domain-containing protein n=1 Tax=Noviherbaspirillum sp. L7-7A TaxID=2850560 RepID=UPI001C2C450B|nr:GGDEF domain-containing protein [Noviherbaspirillum sp. L7-7A]MBV0879249.1 GGDEF domain-containing protein [Noviherbaspirillum sp. L7-7A]